MQQYLPFTVLKLIDMKFKGVSYLYYEVATVLTVYGIETNTKTFNFLFFAVDLLQQYLPFTVLKP